MYNQLGSLNFHRILPPIENYKIKKNNLEIKSITKKRSDVRLGVNKEVDLAKWWN